MGQRRRGQLTRQAERNAISQRDAQPRHTKKAKKHVDKPYGYRKQSHWPSFAAGWWYHWYATERARDAAYEQAIKQEDSWCLAFRDHKRAEIEKCER